MGYHFLLQGIFLTQGLNPNLLSFLHWQALPYREALVPQFPAQGSNRIPCTGSWTLNYWTTSEVLTLVLLIRTLILSFLRSSWPHLNPVTSQRVRSSIYEFWWGGMQFSPQHTPTYVLSAWNLLLLFFSIPLHLKQWEISWIGLRFYVLLFKNLSMEKDSFQGVVVKSHQYFFFNLFIYCNWRIITLWHCDGFCIHQHESAVGIHMSPHILTTPPPPPSPPHPAIFYRTLKPTSMNHANGSSSWLGQLHYLSRYFAILPIQMADNTYNYQQIIQLFRI